MQLRSSINISYASKHGEIYGNIREANRFTRMVKNLNPNRKEIEKFNFFQIFTFFPAYVHAREFMHKMCKLYKTVKPQMYVHLHNFLWTKWTRTKKIQDFFSGFLCHNEEKA
jgi:hypothetical protein